MEHLTFSRDRSSRQSLQTTPRERSPTSAVACNIFTSLFHRIGRVLVAWLCPSDEPTITLITDRQGQIWWRIHDPYTRQSYWCESETEVMIWLGNRYR